MIKDDGEVRVKTCVLSKRLKKEHEKINNKAYAESFVACPMLQDRQLCLWCCLHILDQARPQQKQYSSKLFPSYEMLAGTEFKLSWDEIWKTYCSSCRNNS